MAYVSASHVGAFFSNLLALICVLVCCIPPILSATFYLIFPRPRKDIKDDIVLVTGSGHGLGRELAIQFAKQGCEVVCVDILPEQNLQTVEIVQSLGCKARGYMCNVADRMSVMKLANEVGRVDILVNNAAIYPYRGISNSTEEDVRTILDVNLLSHFWTIQAFLPGMIQRNHGHVVAIASAGVLQGMAKFAPYISSKCGIVGLMNSLYLELVAQESNVKLTTVYPYLMNTRPEIEECVKVRVPPLTAKYAAEVILRGTLENLDSFSVPKDMLYSSNILRLLPKDCVRVFFKYFPVNASAPKQDPFAELMQNNPFKKTVKPT